MLAGSDEGRECYNIAFPATSNPFAVGHRFTNMDKRLLSFLCCPLTHKGLSVANRELMGRVNAAIADGNIRNRDGQTLSDALGEALVTDDGRLLYPVPDGIPALLEGESILLDQLENGRPAA